MISLKGITWDHPRGYQPLQLSVDCYEKETGVRIAWHIRSLKDFGDTAIQTLAQGYDLLVIDHPHMGIAAETGCLTAFDELLTQNELTAISEQSVGPSYNSYNYAGRQWALPVDGACQVAAYRPDILKTSDIPVNWGAVVKLAEQLKAKKEFIGMALCPTDCACSFLTLIAQFGSPLKENDIQVISPAIGLKALQTMMVLKKVCHEKSIYWNPINLYDYMSAEDDTIYSPLGFGYINYAIPAVDKKLLKYASIPGSANSLLGGAGIAVSAQSNYKTEAAAYSMWICDPNYQKNEYVREGGQPGILSAWISPENNIYASEFFSSVLPIIEQSYVRPRLPLWPEFQEWIGDIVHDYLVHNLDIEHVLNVINMEIKRRFCK